MPNLNMPGGRPAVQPMRGGGGGLMKYIITLIVLGVLGGGGYYMYKEEMIPFLQKKAPPPPPPVEIVPPAEEIAAPLPQEILPAPTVNPRAATSPPPQSSEMKAMGTGGFTVVIHSFTVRATAEEVAAQWSNAGFPTMVTEKNFGGSTWYCVTVGRYETQQLARKAAREMEHMLETGYWVDRVQ